MTELDYEAISLPPVSSAPAQGVRAAHSSFLSLLTQLVSAVVTYALQIVLAWYIDHRDFGLLALATSLTMFIGVFRDAGASRILVQRHNEFQRIAGTLFWLTLITSLACGILAVAAARPLAALYAQPVLVPIVYLLAIRFPISSLGTVSGARLLIDMRWTAISLISFASVAVLLIVSIVMARAGFGVYALIVPPLVADATRGLLQWIAIGGKTNLSFHQDILREVFSSSAMLIGSGLAVAARSQGDYCVLGLTSDAASTGAYYFAYTASAIAIRLIGGSVMPVLFAVFAQVGNDAQRRQAVYQRSLHALAMLTVPITALQATLAWPVFRVFVPRFYDAATLFAIISPVHLLLVLNMAMVQPLHATGMYRKAFFFDLIFAPVEVALFWTGAELGGVRLLTIFCLFSAILGFISWHWSLLKTLGFSRRRAILPLWKPLVAVLPIVVMAWSIERAFPHTIIYDLLTISLVSFFGGSIYVLLIRWMWRSVFEDVWRLFRATFSRFFVPAKTT